MAKTLIAGLGNPGTKYNNTPHNIGFAVVDQFVKNQDLGAPVKQSKFEGLLSQSHNLILFKPLTFMNLSGRAVKKVVDFYKIPPDHTFIIHDDITIPLGQLKISMEHGAGNHNGVRSIIDALGTSTFVRFRLGIADGPIHNLESYVLTPFSSSQKSLTNQAIERTVQALTTALEHSVIAAMNIYN